MPSVTCAVKVSLSSGIETAESDINRRFVQKYASGNESGANYFTPGLIITIRAMFTTALAAIAALQVVFFSKNHISFFTEVVIFRIQRLKFS
jgi:hypothetical protein